MHVLALNCDQPASMDRAQIGHECKRRCFHRSILKQKASRRKRDIVECDLNWHFLWCTGERCWRDASDHVCVGHMSCIHVTQMAKPASVLRTSLKVRPTGCHVSTSKRGTACGRKAMQYGEWQIIQRHWWRELLPVE